jgi:MarR family transcriptional regulator for hemolysin
MQAITAPRQSSARLAGELHTFFAYLIQTTTEPVSARLAELDLTLGQMKLLNMLAFKDDAVAVKDIAEALSLSLPAISRTLDGLHRLGYVEREENAQDRRMKDVRISPSGRDALRALTEVRLDLIAQFNDSLAAKERDRLSAALAPLLARPEIARHAPGAATR